MTSLAKYLSKSASLEIVVQEILQNSEEMSVAEFIFRKAGEIFNFLKDQPHLVVPLGIWEIFRTDIPCTTAAGYFQYYVTSVFFIGHKSL